MHLKWEQRDVEAEGRKEGRKEAEGVWTHQSNCIARRVGRSTLQSISRWSLNMRLASNDWPLTYWLLINQSIPDWNFFTTPVFRFNCLCLVCFSQRFGRLVVQLLDLLEGTSQNGWSCFRYGECWLVMVWKHLCPLVSREADCDRFEKQLSFSCYFCVTDFLVNWLPLEQALTAEAQLFPGSFAPLQIYLWPL